MILYRPREVSNTADITHKDLKTARESVGMYQHQVAYLMHVSEDTVSRWERGEVIPTPDQVSELETFYKAPGLWYGWMRYQYKSFRDRFPDNPGSEGLALAMLNAGYQIDDMLKRQNEVLRDVMDGKIDNSKGFAEWLKEATEAHAAMGEMLARAGGIEQR